jgi:hypothetical protein
MMVSNVAADVCKLLAWLAESSPITEAEIVKRGCSHVLDKALSYSFVEIIDGAVVLTAAGRLTLSRHGRPKKDADLLDAAKQALVYLDQCRCAPATCANPRTLLADAIELYEAKRS